MPGETQLGPFTIERELGRGGMGVVYAAAHEGREVALKVSVDDLPERDRKHFLEEAALLSRIAHPGVIEILGSGTLDDGRPYLVMPLLRGETLAERLQRGRLDPDLALRLFAQLAGAVAALHDAGIVHRDIKPENVMYLEGEERLILLDFGIAREIDRPASTTTRMNLVRGTPGCMAPERFFGTRASASSDVYELAVVLYAMVAGRLPWDEPTDPEARLRPRHPAELGVDLPVGLGHILLEALSTRPERRPSARELSARVRAVEGAPLTPHSGATGRTTIALPARAPMDSPAPRARSVAPPSDQKARREIPAPVWIAGAAVVTALAVGGSLWVRGARSGAPAYARPGLGRLVLAATLRTARDLPVDNAGAASGPAADLVTEKAPAPPTAAPAAPPAASTTTPVTTGAPMASPLPSAPAPSASPSFAPAAPGNPWCARMVELYCTPSARKLPGGEQRCQDRRAEVARMANLPDSMRARAEAQCRDAIPSIEKSIRTPQASEASEDMPWCKRVVAAYCSPEVKNSYGGDALCSQAQSNFYARYLSMAPDVRSAQNEKCAQLLPAVTQAMRQHVRDLGPGTAASARLGGAAQGGVPPAPPPGAVPAGGVPGGAAPPRPAVPQTQPGQAAPGGP